MFTSPNLGLTVWDLTNDDFSHDQLEQNWLALDTHDHSPGHGVQIGGQGLADQAVTNAKLAPNSVGATQLQPNSVGSANLQPGSVTTAAIAAGAITGNLIPAGAIGASMLDPTILPLGSVMLWWRSPTSTVTPGGFWEAMDGRPWSGITNALGLTTGNIPDTRGRFAKGADLLAAQGPAIGVTGGAATVNLAHWHNLNPHRHRIPPHRHVIDDDGDHHHRWFGGLHLGARTNCLDIGISVPATFGGQLQNRSYSLYIQDLLSDLAWAEGGLNGGQKTDDLADMDEAGRHNHGGWTEDSDDDLDSDDADGDTDIQLTNVTIDPRWVGLLYIMRVR